MIVAIDPGIRGCGLACGTEQTLTHGEFVKNPIKQGCDVATCVAMGLAVDQALASANIGAVTLAIFEWPRVYRGSKLKGDPNDLLPLVGVCTSIATKLGVRAEQIFTVRPEEWKGQVPKHIMNARVWKKLTVEEQSHVQAWQKDTLDAVGIYLHHIGRLR